MIEDILPLVDTLRSSIREHPKLLSASLAVLLSCLTRYLSQRRSRRKAAPLPPGPRPRALIGNLLQIPTFHPWKVYTEWRKEYGDLIYMSALGQGILVINNREIAHELLVKRAPNYSDRAYTPVTKLIHFDWAFSMMNHGAEWREQRRMFHQALNYTQVSRYHPVMEQEMRSVLPRLLADPEGHRNHLRYLLASIIMRVSYGSEDYEYNKTLANSAEKVIHGFMKYTNPANLLVNTLHSLRFVPAWVPGAGWQRTLAEIGAHSDAVTEGAYLDTKERMRTGTQSNYSAFAVQLIEKLPKKSDPDYARQDETVKHVSAMLYAAGADTSVSTALAVVLALGMNPQVQRRAQEDLDTVVGRGRLPTAEDIAHLPYITAIVKETSRWHTVLPLGFAHRSKEDDVYNGYRIPAGTIIFPNAWAMMHDSALFENPFDFIPERYIKDGKIDPSVLDPEAAVFGFGRRICPGRHFSNESLELTVATLLTCFNIEPVLDKQGNPVPIRYEVPNNTISTPCPYECTFVPRSQEHINLIHSISKKDGLS